MNQSINIAVIIGTRAQFIKTAPVMRALDKRGIPYRFIFTAQHRETIDAIREDFGIKAPDYVLPCGDSEAKTIGLFGGWACRALWALLFFRRKIIPFKRGVVINHGDTATCLWGTILARLTGNQAMHLESGLRSFHLFKPFPEELIRLLTFIFTTIYVCPNEWAVNNLKRYRGVKLNTGLNTLYDAVQMALSAGRTDPECSRERPYAVVSIHRFEHIFKPSVFELILGHLERISSSMRLVFVAHPATVQQLERLGFRKRLDENSNIAVCERLAFFDFISLIQNSEYVITDGGSNQEELSYLGKPTLIMRQATERCEGLGENAVLSKLDSGVIDDFCNGYKEYSRPAVNVDESPSEVIRGWLEKWSLSESAEDAEVKSGGIWRTVSALIVLAVAAAYIWTYRVELLSMVKEFNPFYAPHLLLVAIVSIGINGMIMNVLVSQFGVRLKGWECFGLTAVGSLSNYLPVPQAGGIIRGVYLKKTHQLSYDVFTATVLVAYVMALPAIGGLGLFCLLMMLFGGLHSPLSLWVFFAGLSASLALFGPAMGLLRPFRKFARFQEGFDMLLKRHVIGRIVFLQIAQLLLTGVALWLSFRALGNLIGWSGSVMLGLLANAAGVANVTPGNIGIVESATALGAYLLKGNPNLAVVAYSVYRAASLVVLVIVSSIFMIRWKKGDVE